MSYAQMIGAICVLQTLQLAAHQQPAVQPCNSELWIRRGMCMSKTKLIQSQFLLVMLEIATCTAQQVIARVRGIPQCTPSEHAIKWYCHPLLKAMVFKFRTLQVLTCSTMCMSKTFISPPRGTCAPAAASPYSLLLLQSFAVPH